MDPTKARAWTRFDGFSTAMRRQESRDYPLKASTGFHLINFPLKATLRTRFFNVPLVSLKAPLLVFTHRSIALDQYIYVKNVSLVIQYNTPTPVPPNWNFEIFDLLFSIFPGSDIYTNYYQAESSLHLDITVLAIQENAIHPLISSNRCIPAELWNSPEPGSSQPGWRVSATWRWMSSCTGTWDSGSVCRHIDRTQVWGLRTTMVQYCFHLRLFMKCIFVKTICTT